MPLYESLAPFPESVINRFWSFVNKRGVEDCWLYTGPQTRCYGYFSVSGTHVYAHRLSFFISHGFWPNPFCCHTCDVPLCCNPRHLFEGTAATNNADCARKGRAKVAAKGKPGENNIKAQLTEVDVYAIYDCLCNGEKPTVIARRYGVKAAAISKIACRRTWRHLPLERIGAVRGVYSITQ